MTFDSGRARCVPIAAASARSAHVLHAAAREAGTPASIRLGTGLVSASVIPMNVTEAIYARRAVRSYTPQKVDEATVRSLLRAAVQAPSAMNLQPWVFGVVQDAARLARWSEQREGAPARAGRALAEDEPLRDAAARTELQHLLRREHARRDRRQRARDLYRRRLLARGGEPDARGLRGGPRHVLHRLRDPAAEHAGGEGGARAPVARASPSRRSSSAIPRSLRRRSRAPSRRSCPG